MWDNFLITLSIMGKGMVGIFTVIIIISLVVALMGRLGTGKNRMKKIREITAIKKSRSDSKLSSRLFFCFINALRWQEPLFCGLPACRLSHQ